ncbi:TolC family protein [Candidatus Sarmatiella mevalonica]|uniref:TolC family protein n=1 Tax=Candidatus Sarmatiella mevalonica TaxID=2770581 RepID=UPI0019219DDC|nr:TolC family protein [Candidatus Sarmatiella mevalonica]
MTKVLSRHRLSIIVFCVELLLHVSQAHAQINLHQALSSAYNTNDNIKLAQDDFLQEIESFAQARAQFLPNINANFDKVEESRKLKSAQELSGLRLDQSLFSGGSSVFSLTAAEYEFKSSKARLYASEQKILLDAIRAYLNCIQTKEAVSVAQISLQDSRVNLKAVEAQFKAGETNKIDLESAKAAVAQNEADFFQAQANEIDANAHFIKAIGLQPTSLVTPQILDDLPQTYEEFLNVSRNFDFEIQYFRSKIQVAQYALKAAKGALLPQVNFVVDAGKLYQYDQLAGQQSSNAIATRINATLPIYSKGGLEYSKIRVAKISQNKAISFLDNSIKENEAKCRSAWQSFQASRARMRAAQDAVNAAQIAYDGTVQEQLLGSKSILDVLITQRRLNEAKVTKIRAFTEYAGNYFQIKALMSQLNAQVLKLDATYFNPDKEFNRIKSKLIGY